MTRRYRLRALCEAQNWRCAYCGIVMSLEMPLNRADSATRDHYRPKVAGGSDGWGNLVAACHRCNNARGSQPAERFLDRVGEKGKALAAEIARALAPQNASRHA